MLFVAESRRETPQNVICCEVVLYKLYVDEKYEQVKFVYLRVKLTFGTNYTRVKNHSNRGSSCLNLSLFVVEDDPDNVLPRLIISPSSNQQKKGFKYECFLSPQIILQSHLVMICSNRPTGAYLEKKTRSVTSA